MIKKENTRIIITMTKNQADWLKKTAKRCNTSVSKLIKWLIDKNVARIQDFLSEEDWKRLQKIVHTPWININDEDLY